MKRQLSEIEALLNEKYFESKIDMIPASLKTIYSAVGGKDVLVARELIINDRVMLGVEYTPDGLIAGAYTTDKNGRRVRVESNYEKTEANRTPHNLISERLDEVAKTLAREERERKNDVSSLAPEKPAPKAENDAYKPRWDAESARRSMEQGQIAYTVLAIVACIVFAAFMLLTVANLPGYGSADAPTVNEVAERYVEKGTEETGAVNTVAGMILDYRAP